MTAPETFHAPPTRLAVIGAAGGAGRVLCQHLFARMTWESVVLVDRPKALAGLREAADTFPGVPELASFEGEMKRIRGSCELNRPGTTVVLAVPVSEYPDVVAVITPMLGQDTTIVDASSMKVLARDYLADHVGHRHVFGVRPLFDSLARALDGQTVVVTGPEPGLSQTRWFRDAVEELGGIVKDTTPEEHDRSMCLVQTLTQQTLLAFADAVLDDDRDVERELWEMRTPTFETMMGLAVRLMAEAQVPSVSQRQAHPDAKEAHALIDRAVDRLAGVVGDERPVDLAAHVDGVRDRLSGSLFETIYATASAVVSATQAKRAALSRHRRNQTPVGVITADRPDDLRVGVITDLSPTDVIVEETLVGPRGGAVILDGEGLRNARTLGVGGKRRRTRFGIGRIEVVTGAELDARLDGWLAYIRRDVRFLVPESVAGEGIVHVVAQVPRVRNPAVVSQVVRTGQRAVVVRVEIRADSDVDAMVESLRDRVADAYAWPGGLARRRRTAARTNIVYLGPAGTFSETGARQSAASLDLDDAPLIALGSFEEVLDAVRGGDLGVIPICSSSSGLVERAADALLVSGSDLEAGGVADVPVRFDAYVPEGAHLEDLRGAQVFSHPQALRQCARFIARWDLTPVTTSSTASAGRKVADGDTPAVALAGAGLGNRYGLQVAEREVDDLSGSLTRFLLLGRVGSFGALTGGSDPTLRSLWIAEQRDVLGDVLDGEGPAFDELISTRSGRVLLVTSREPPTPVPMRPGRAWLGRLPWTPRTPLVRLGDD